MSAWKPTVSRLADPLQQVDHLPPGVHAAPADLPFRRQPFAVVAGRSWPACLKVSAILAWFPSGSSAQSLDAARRVDPDDAVRPDAQLAEPAGDLAALADLRQELRPAPRPRRSPSRRRWAARPGPRPSRSPALASGPCRPAPSVRHRSRRCRYAARTGTGRSRRT